MQKVNEFFNTMVEYIKFTYCKKRTNSELIRFGFLYSEYLICTQLLYYQAEAVISRVEAIP